MFTGQTVVLVCGMYIYLRIHQVVSINYIQLFISQVYFSKGLERGGKKKQQVSSTHHHTCPNVPL